MYSTYMGVDRVNILEHHNYNLLYRSVALEEQGLLVSRVGPTKVDKLAPGIRKLLLAANDGTTGSEDLRNVLREEN